MTRKMAVADILALKAPVARFCPGGMAQGLECKNVTTPEYRQILTEMTAEGRTRKPVRVDERTVVEGCHRVKLAIELGWTEMDVTSNWREAV